MYNEIDGDLIALAKNGKFDVIVHGCNCMNTMKAGIAPKMAKAFGCDGFPLEAPEYRGDINKLGQIDYEPVKLNIFSDLYVVNAYTQYHYVRWFNRTRNLDYDALTMCMRKINHKFKGSHIGLPQIGAGLAGGVWKVIQNIIERELKDCEVTVVKYNKKD